MRRAAANSCGERRRTIENGGGGGGSFGPAVSAALSPSGASVISNESEVETGTAGTPSAGGKVGRMSYAGNRMENFYLPSSGLSPREHGGFCLLEFPFTFFFLSFPPVSNDPLTAQLAARSALRARCATYAV